MKKILCIIIILLWSITALGAGTTTDYVDLENGEAFPPGGGANEAMIDYDPVNDVWKVYADDGNWYSIGVECYNFKPVAASPITQEGIVYYRSDTDQLYVRTGAAAWEELNGSTLDDTYTQGATITIDATGTLTLTSTLDDATDMLTITRSDSGSGTGQLIMMTDTQDAAHASIILDHTSGNANSGGLHIRDNAANAANLAYGLLVESVDATTEIVDAIKVLATTNAMITDAIDVSDAELTNAINTGANIWVATDLQITSNPLTIGADGDFRTLETGGSTADPDFQVDGFGQIYSGALGDDASNYTGFTTDGVLSFHGNARPSHREWHSVQDLDLVMAGGDGTDPVENEAGGTGKYSSWTFTEATSIAYYSWLIPCNCDVTAAINVYIVWLTENNGGDSCLWRVRHDGGKTFNNDEIPTAPATVLNTPIADDTTDVKYEEAITAAGIINASTFAAGELVTFDFYLTDCDAGGAPDYADMIGFIIEYSLSGP